MKKCNVIAIIILCAFASKPVDAMESDKKDLKKSKASWADSQDSPRSQPQTAKKPSPTAFKKPTQVQIMKSKFSSQPPKGATIIPGKPAHEHEHDETALFGSLNRNLFAIRGTLNNQMQETTSISGLLAQILQVQKQQLSMQKQILSQQKISNGHLNQLVLCKQMQQLDQAEYYVQMMQPNQSYEQGQQEQYPVTYAQQSDENFNGQTSAAGSGVTQTISPIQATYPNASQNVAFDKKDATTT